MKSLAVKLVLVVKYVGYKDLEVSASSNMRIIMEEDSELLEMLW